MSSEILTSKLNQFCFKLFNTLSQKKDENFFISPLSISTALTMAYSGANSATADQLKETLCLNDQSKEDIYKLNQEYLTLLHESLSDQVALKIGNRVFQNQGFPLNPEFSQNLQKYFRSDAQLVDFGDNVKAAAEINDWVLNQTANKIKDLVGPDALDSLTRLVLVNAIYFKGNWMHKFKESNTEKADFFLKDGKTTVKVDMMKLTDKKFRYKRNPADLKACTCEFPYAGETVSMTIILPHEGVNIEEVESELNEKVLAEVLHRVPMPGPVPIHAYIPKFKMEYKQELSQCLKTLGATDAFDQDKADFSLISPSPEALYVSQVIHQAVVELNEQGTEAAAATAVVMKMRCMVMDFNPPPEKFECNRPFLFVIHETNSNGILFMGKYMCPPS